MSNVIEFPSSEAASSAQVTGRSLAVEAFMEAVEQGNTEAVARKHAGHVIECLRDCSSTEALALLQGFILTALELPIVDVVRKSS